MVNSHEHAFDIEVEQEADGRWIADITNVPGAMAYGETKGEATAKAIQIALGIVCPPNDGM